MNVIHHYVKTENKLSHYLAKMAVRALYFELKAHPKPGLVSFIDSGAHHDMDGKIFYRSILSLRHYFYHISREGLMNGSFEVLKCTAIHAEQRMLERTQGVNTHRGAIFALGVCCVSVARLSLQCGDFTPNDLHQQIVSDWAIHLANHAGHPNSHGALVRLQYQVIDAKQMAIRGYDEVFQLLPYFINLFVETKSIDAACLFAYLKLLVGTDDTNVLYRKGKCVLDDAKKRAADLLVIDCIETRRKKALDLHGIFSINGISPGGVADLMGVLLFIGQLFCEQLRCHYL